MIARQRIGKLKWSDVWVWPGIIGLCLAGFALWVLLSYYCEMPDEVRKGYVSFLIAGLFISLLKMKTVLEYDGKFLYIASIRFFMRSVSCKIRVEDITEIQFFPDLWARRTPWDIFYYRFSQLPKEKRTFGQVWRLMFSSSFYPFTKNMRYFDDEKVSVADVCIYLKAKIVYGSREYSFAVKRYDEVWKFMCHMKENLKVGG